MPGWCAEAAATYGHATPTIAPAATGTAIAAALDSLLRHHSKAEYESFMADWHRDRPPLSEEDMLNLHPAIRAAYEAFIAYYQSIPTSETPESPPAKSYVIVENSLAVSCTEERPLKCEGTNCEELRRWSDLSPLWSAKDPSFDVTDFRPSVLPAGRMPLFADQQHFDALGRLTAKQSYGKDDMLGGISWQDMHIASVNSL